MAPSAQLHRKLTGPMSFLSKSSWSRFTASGSTDSSLASSKGTAGSETAVEEADDGETPLVEDSEYDFHLSSEHEESDGLHSLEEGREAVTGQEAVAAEPVDKPAIVRPVQCCLPDRQSGAQMCAMRTCRVRCVF